MNINGLCYIVRKNKEIVMASIRELGASRATVQRETKR